MAMTTDVNLPRWYPAQFPDRCVVCGSESPNSQVRLITGSIGWWTWLLLWFGSMFTVKAPSCRSCAWKLHGMRFLSLLATIVVVVIALWFIWPHFEESVPRAIQKFAKLGLALACLLPLLLFEVFFAKPFDVTAYTDTVDYEFTSKEYALEFAALNLDSGCVKIDGEIIA